MWIRRVPGGVAAVLGWKLPVAEVLALSRVGDGEPSREAVARVVDAVQWVVADVVRSCHDLRRPQSGRFSDFAISKNI